MGTAARGWAAVLLLAAVFLGHGLQCSAAAGVGSGAHGAHGGAPPVVSLAAPDAALTPSAGGHGPEVSALVTHQDAPPAAAGSATAGSTPGHRHALPGHLWAACLAVLAAGLAVLLGLAAPRPVRSALPTAASARPRRPSWPAPPRPPDLLAFCVLRT